MGIKPDCRLFAQCDRSTVRFSVFGFCVQFDKPEFSTSQKTSLKTRLLSLVMPVVCVVGLFPITALAAGAAPDSVTLTNAEFSGNYNFASLGSCGIHVMSMNVNGQTHDSFCAEHGKGMGSSLTGHAWKNPTAANNSVIKLMIRAVSHPCLFFALNV